MITTTSIWKVFSNTNRQSKNTWENCKIFVFTFTTLRAGHFRPTLKTVNLLKNLSSFKGLLSFLRFFHRFYLITFIQIKFEIFYHIKLKMFIKHSAWEASLIKMFWNLEFFCFDAFFDLSKINFWCFWGQLTQLFCGILNFSIFHVISHSRNSNFRLFSFIWTYRHPLAWKNFQNMISKAKLNAESNVIVKKNHKIYK